MYISASNASDVRVSIDPGALATMGYVETAIADHDSLATAHENRFKLFEKISDFGDDLIKKLALTTAISAVTALQTDSWFGQLLKMVLTASGVRYNIAQNGYVCFGSFFGGLIIQWVEFGQSGSPIKMIFPIAFTTNQYAATGSDYNNSNNGCVLNFYDKHPEYCMISGNRIIDHDYDDADTFGTGIFVGW